MRWLTRYRYPVAAGSPMRLSSSLPSEAIYSQTRPSNFRAKGKHNRRLSPRNNSGARSTRIYLLPQKHDRSTSIPQRYSKAIENRNHLARYSTLFLREVTKYNSLGHYLVLNCFPFPRRFGRFLPKDVVCMKSALPRQRRRPTPPSKYWNIFPRKITVVINVGQSGTGSFGRRGERSCFISLVFETLAYVYMSSGALNEFWTFLKMVSRPATGS